MPGAEKIVDAIARLNRYAAEHGIVVISTVDAHAEDDLEFRSWPPHCVTGTTGQRKPAATLLEKRIVIPNAPCEADLSPDLSRVQQILLEKQALDCFTNRNLSRILANLGAERYAVYGVVTEICVKCAARGLLKTGKRVELVTDAVRSLDDRAAEEMTRAFAAQGGVLTTVDAVTAR